MQDTKTPAPTSSAPAQMTPGARAVERALEEWREDIREPKGKVTDGPILT